MTPLVLHLEAVQALVAAEGPPRLATYAERLASLPADARVITPSGDVAGSSARLAAVLDRLPGWPRSPGVGG